jgi:hypothetical protein
MRRLIAAVALSAASLHANALIDIPPNYTTGNDYRGMSRAEQLSYIEGVVDGYFAAPLFAMVDLKRVANLNHCTHGMNVGQLTAIANKYMDENPAIWAQGMNTIFFRAMLAACKSIGKPLD